MEADTMLVGWGSTCGALREAVAIMLENGASVNMMHFDELWPFPSEIVSRALDDTPNAYVVENNAGGQLARLIKAETGKSVNENILKYNGRPFTPEQIISELKGVH
jgi:2-oxoglutarate ferredoxin oxidoreductase subunit alpha